MSFGSRFITLLLGDIQVSFSHYVFKSLMTLKTFMTLKALTLMTIRERLFYEWRFNLVSDGLGSDAIVWPLVLLML